LALASFPTTSTRSMSSSRPAVHVNVVVGPSAAPLENQEVDARPSTANPAGNSELNVDEADTVPCAVTFTAAAAGVAGAGVLGGRGVGAVVVGGVVVGAVVDAPPPGSPPGPPTPGAGANGLPARALAGAGASWSTCWPTRRTNAAPVVAST